MEEPPHDFSQESGSAPSSLRLVLKLVKKANDLARRKNGSLHRKFTDLLELKVPANAKPQHGVSTKDIVIDKQTGVWARVFLPEEPKSKDPRMPGKKPVIFYFHGGAFALLCANFYLYDIFCRRLSRRSQAVVISVNYRRSPEHRYPAAYDDCFGALRWLQGKGQAELPADADVSRCFLMGDSAGANIVHHVGYKAAREDMNPVAIAGHVLLCPFFGGEERTEAQIRLSGYALVTTNNSDWYWKAYLPKDATRDHPACNVFGPQAPDLTCAVLLFPPSLVVIAEYDALKDWQLRYVQGLKTSGQPVRLLYYKGAVHSFHLFHKYKLSSQILSDLVDFIGASCPKDRKISGKALATVELPKD